MPKHRRTPARHHRLAPRAPTQIAALIIAMTTTIATAASAAAALKTAAHAARTLNGNATAHLHLIKAEGSQLTEQGPVSGALNGTATAELRTGALFTATFTIHTHDGTITGHGQATPHGSGRYQSFSGSFSATAGSGRYNHIKGRAGLYGVFDRRSDSVVIQTTGTLTY